MIEIGGVLYERWEDIPDRRTRVEYIREGVPEVAKTEAELRKEILETH